MNNTTTITTTERHPAYMVLSRRELLEALRALDARKPDRKMEMHHTLVADVDLHVDPSGKVQVQLLKVTAN